MLLQLVALVKQNRGKMDKAFEADRVIAFRPEIAKYLGSIESALIYQQLCHWQQYAQRQDGFVFKSAQELSEETAVNVRAIHRIREKLVAQGLIEVKKIMAKGSPTYHYRVLVVPTTLLTSSTDTVSVPTVKNYSSITKNTHNISIRQNRENIDRLYKGWLIEMLIGSGVWLRADADSRISLMDGAKAKCRLTPKREGKLAARLDSLGIELCAKAIKKIGQSDFHKGQNDRKWKATIEWLFNTDEKVEEFANR